MYTTRVCAQSSTDDMNKSHFRCQLSRPLSAVRSINLLNANFANTNPNIEAGANLMTVVISDSIQGTLAVPEGNYNHTDLITMLAGYLNDWGHGVFAITYDPVTFKVTVTGNALFKLRVDRESILPQLGFLATTGMAMSHTGQVPVRLNTNRGILVTVAGFERLDVPNIMCASSFYVPVFAQAGDIAYVSQSDLGDQTVHLHSDGLDLSFLDISLRRSDRNAEYTIKSDSSFLFEIKHN